MPIEITQVPVNATATLVYQSVGQSTVHIRDGIGNNASLAIGTDNTVAWATITVGGQPTTIVVNGTHISLFDAALNGQGVELHDGDELWVVPQSPSGNTYATVAVLVEK